MTIIWILIGIAVLGLLLAGVALAGRRGAVEAPKAPPKAGPAAPPPPVVEAPPEPWPGVEIPEAPPVGIPETPPVAEAPRWRDRLSRARQSFGANLTGIFNRGSLTEEDWEDIEALLLQADVGVVATQRMIADLRERSKKETDPEAVVQTLHAELVAILGDGDRSLARNEGGLTIWLVTGVNGTGKTTTIGKLAGRLAREGKSVVLAAADTFRAAADAQLETWASRSGAEVVKHAAGADPAAVAFDGVRAAKARGSDFLIVDTAGRLHTKTSLMEELAKIRRVVEREAGPPHEVLLVLDATTGQNGIAQARAFTEAAGVTGIALTKLDGTAKGGIVIACQQELGLPVKLVGLGEGIEDLAPFDPHAFVDALLD
ncbi:MAG: signal recognition particle-docking protein FtsY [Actinomycetota bacterium]|nr:signal recognition particle-docking protein FtsY [Actinomycetota bacterium]